MVPFYVVSRGYQTLSLLKHYANLTVLH